jgi:hypothetical protein
VLVAPVAPLLDAAGDRWGQQTASTVVKSKV